MAPILLVEELSVRYRTERGEVRALEELSFELERGKSMAIVGESGSGKTTIGLTLMRSLPPNASIVSGRVIMDGVDVLSIGIEEFRKRFSWKVISMVFQNAMNALNPVVKVGEQIVEPLVVSGSIPRSEAVRRGEELLEMVRLSRSIYHRYPHELSGGMKQRVMIAMALAMNPRIVIFDEPTSALDVTIQAQIVNLIKDLIDQLDLTVLFITHDIALATEVADEVLVMYAGQAVELGPMEEVVSNPMHPYTEMLLSCVPDVRRSSRPSFIPGSPPDLIDPPKGCRFHPRCPYAMERCRSEEPPLVMPEGRVRVRCWLRC